MIDLALVAGSQSGQVASGPVEAFGRRQLLAEGERFISKNRHLDRDAPCMPEAGRRGLARSRIRRPAMFAASKANSRRAGIQL